VCRLSGSDRRSLASAVQSGTQRVICGSKAAPTVRFSGLRITTQDWPRTSPCLLSDLRCTHIGAGVRACMRLGMRLLRSICARWAESLRAPRVMGEEHEPHLTAPEVGPSIESGSGEGRFGAGPVRRKAEKLASAHDGSSGSERSVIFGLNDCRDAASTTVERECRPWVLPQLELCRRCTAVPRSFEHLITMRGWVLRFDHERCVGQGT
jgi:hypothetical protein